MIDPVSIGAGAIAKLAFDELVKAGAGEVAKATVAGAVDLIKGLRDRIRAQFAGNARATTALTEAEQQPSEAAIAKVTKYLDLEMDEAPAFADEVRQMAQQIITIQQQSAIQQQNTNYGRDQIIINQPQGDLRIGGS